MGVRAISEEAQLPIGSTHRLLKDLEQENVLLRTQENEWILSYRLLNIVGIQLDRFSLIRMARPFCEKISRKVGESVNINVLINGRSVTVEKFRGDEGMQMDAPVGSSSALNLGGSAKALLAYLDPGKQEEILRGQLSAMTPNSITDPEALREEIKKIRRRGYSLDHDEVVVGVHCVSMVVLDHRSLPVAAISISGPSRKMESSKLQPLVDMLSEVCGTASRSLGYGGPWLPIETAH